MNNYCLKIQLRYSDYDTQKFINHSKICTFIETTYVYFLTEKINPSWNANNMPLVLRREITDFLIPIELYSDPICVLTVLEVKGASFMLKIDVIDEKTNKMYVTCERVLVFIDVNSKKPMPIDALSKEKLNQFKSIS